MELVKTGFPKIMKDNEEQYFVVLRGLIESVDNMSYLEINKSLNSYHFRLSMSSSIYTDALIKEIINFHNLIHIRLKMSKSIKSSGAISFEIFLNQNQEYERKR